MKSKKQNRKYELAASNCQQRLDIPPPVKITFNISHDNIACFVGEKKNNKKKTTKSSTSLNKTKTSKSNSSRHSDKSPKKHEPNHQIAKTQCQEILQGALNTILSQIQSKGIGCKWNESNDEPVESESSEQNLANSSLWSVFSVNQQFNKSYASTIDVLPEMNYFMNNYNQYYYDYSYKSFDESSLFVVRLQNIQNDPRTTIMIRNIPNKYALKQLAQQIDSVLPNTYDFLYLPCDIKNQCNVGYGFINFLTTEYLEEFYQEFHGKRWSKFRSEKICNLTYARLQGLDKLIEHFEHSKVYNQKDKKYKPFIRQFGKIEQIIKCQQTN